MTEPRVHIVLWKWDQENCARSYTAEHVNVMAAMLHRNISALRYRIICITDNPHGITECETYPLWRDHADIPNATKPMLPSCYRRLKLYDRETQRALDIDEGDRICGLDIDAVICKDIAGILRTQGRFVGWELAGPLHSTVFNGSLQMFTAGDLQEIWSSFDPEVSPEQALVAGWLGSDQAWLSMNLIGKEGSVGLLWPEVASYPVNVIQGGVHSAKTKLMFFNGMHKPWDDVTRKASPFIDRYWRL